MYFRFPGVPHSVRTNDLGDRDCLLETFDPLFGGASRCWLLAIARFCRRPCGPAPPSRQSAPGVIISPPEPDEEVGHVSRFFQLYREGSRPFAAGDDFRRMLSASPPGPVPVEQI